MCTAFRRGWTSDREPYSEQDMAFARLAFGGFWLCVAVPLPLYVRMHGWDLGLPTTQSQTSGADVAISVTGH